jgi:hypothetical protein
MTARLSLLSAERVLKICDVRERTTGATRRLAA